MVRILNLVVGGLIVGTLLPGLSAQEKPAPKADLVIVYEPPEQPLPNLNRMSLGDKVPGGVGQAKRTEQPIKALLGAEPQRIKVRYYDPKRFATFADVQKRLLWILDTPSQDKSLYRYQAWAEGVSPSIVAIVEYKNKAQGALEVGGIGAHLYFQDANGDHWWTRLPAAGLLGTDPFKK